MYELSNINVIKSLLSKYGFNFSKGLGQNFITDPGLCPQIVEDSQITEKMGIIEIGPGIGVLTQEIAKRAKKVVSVEIDNRLIPILDDTLSDFDNIEIINNDFMKIDIAKLIDEKFKDTDVGVCANIPYYITSPILMKILESRADVKFVVAMVQKEAAERICAEAGTRECGAISLAVRYYSKPEILFDVPRESFIPAPNVDSSVIKLDIKKERLLNCSEEKNFFKIIKCAFGKRRKTLINALSGNFAMSKSDMEKIFNELGISTKSRAEELKFNEFIELSKKIQ